MIENSEEKNPYQMAMEMAMDTIKLKYVKQTMKLIFCCHNFDLGNENSVATVILKIFCCSTKDYLSLNSKKI